MVGAAARTADLFEGPSTHNHPGGATGALAAPLSDLFDQVPVDWREWTQAFRLSDAGKDLVARVDAVRLDGQTVYPADVFAALRLTRKEQVRVVILGQDPYHGAGQAHGLAFSVLPGVTVPPSLRNIFKELQQDVCVPAPRSGDLRGWAQRGVFLLNTALTVEAGRPGSHATWGWGGLTDALVAALACDPLPKVFMLWGAHAQRKHDLIKAGDAAHWVLQCNHPSPLSAARGVHPFMGCGHFSQAATFLDRVGRPITWDLP